jgi:hypothetical protein
MNWSRIKGSMSYLMNAITIGAEAPTSNPKIGGTPTNGP